MDPQPNHSGTPPSAAPAGPPPVLWSRWPQFALALLLLTGVAVLVGRWVALRAGFRPTEHHPTAASVVDLNSAGRTELLQLPGVGPSLAERILADRATNGPFRSVEDLGRVRGIGDATLGRLRPWVSVNVPPPMDRAPGEEESALAVWSPHASPEPVRLERKPPAPSQPPALAYAARGGKLRPGDPPLNVNRAGYEELQKLPGIGKVLAGNILEERRRRPFASVEDLLRVKGIGSGRLEQLRPFVVVE